MFALQEIKKELEMAARKVWFYWSLQGERHGDVVEVIGACITKEQFSCGRRLMVRIVFLPICRLCSGVFVDLDSRLKDCRYLHEGMRACACGFLCKDGQWKASRDCMRTVQGIVALSGIECEAPRWEGVVVVVPGPGMQPLSASPSPYSFDR